MAAVQQDGWALQNVDPELKKDREIVLAAVKRNEKIGCMVGPSRE